MTEFQHKLAYTEKYNLCLLYGRFKPRSSSGTAVTPQGCDVSMLWMREGMWRSRALIRIAVSGVRRNTYTPVLVGKLRLSWFSLQREHAVPAKNGPQNPIYFEQATAFFPCLIISSTLRATRAPWASRAGPPSNLRVELKSDTSTFEYERHRACLSVKTSNDESSHVPLHARTLRGVALSS